MIQSGVRKADDVFYTPKIINKGENLLKYQVF